MPAEAPPTGRRRVPSISSSSRRTRPHGRGRRQGARRLSEAARGRQGQDRAGRRDRRRGQDARPGRRILAGRPAARGRGADRARQGLSRPVGVGARKRMAGETAPPVAAPDPRDKRFADPEWSSNQFFDFIKQAYLLTTQLGRPPGQGRRRARSAHAAQGRVLRPADRQRDRAVELRADQSGTAARDARRRTPRTSCAACTCWPRTSRPATAT